MLPRRNRRWRVSLTSLTLVILGVSGFVASPIRAEDTSAEGTVKKSKGGLNFQLPPDWPVEKRGGMIIPIPVEEYLGKKFKEVESRLHLLEQQQSGFDIRLRAIEEAIKAQRALQSTDQGHVP